MDRNVLKMDPESQIWLIFLIILMAILVLAFVFFGWRGALVYLALLVVIYVVMIGIDIITYPRFSKDIANEDSSSENEST